MSLDASFCQSCGRETLEKRRVEDRRLRESLHDKQRATQAMVIVFLGVLLGLVLSPRGAVVVPYLVFLLSGVIAVVHLAPRAFAASLAASAPLRTTFAYLALGALIAVPTFLLSYLYVFALMGDGGETGAAADGLSLSLLLTVCILPALVEEWLCRGVLWEAARRIAGAGNTILITAILFAMMHGLGGGWFLEFPHRFAMGLIFGWLRLRSRSLLPGMLAHFVHNLLALVV